jgi:hypothetical protein
MPIGLREVKAPTLLRQKANKWRQGCQPTRQPHFTPRFLYLFLNTTEFSFLKYNSIHILIYKYNRMQKVKELFMFAFVISSNLHISLFIGNDTFSWTEGRFLLRVNSLNLCCVKAGYMYSFRSVN